MGRSRKTQFGSTNNDIKKQFLSKSLSIDSSSSILLKEDLSKSSLIENNVYTQKLITPTLKSLEYEKNTDRRQIKVISTWNPKDMYQRKFFSETQDSFADPDVIKKEKSRIKEEKLKQAVAEEHKNERIPLMFRTLGYQANKRYNGAAKMFKIVGNKETNDMITLSDFNEFMKKANLDEMIPETDQKSMFESLDDKGRGRIPLFKILQRVDIKDPQQIKDMKLIRDFLAKEVDKKNLESLSHSASESDILNDKTKAVKDLMKRSMSQKTFDVDVDPITLNDIIEDKVNDSTLNAEERRIAKHLRITNLQLNVVPFYDSRSEFIEHLQRKVESVGTTLKGEVEKLKKLSIIKKQLDSANFNNSSQLVDDLSVTQSLNDKECFDGRVSTSPSVRLMTTPINKRYLSNDGIKSAPRNLAGSITDLNYFSETAKNESFEERIDLKRPQTTPIKSSSSPGRSQIYDKHSSTLDDFSPNKNDASFRPKLKDSSVVLIEPQKYSEPEKRPAKRELNNFNVHTNSQHDWNTMDQTYGSFAPVDETFKTTNSFYFTPVIYEATKNPRRQIISDSSKSLAEQEMKRIAKYNRSQLSVAATENRIALAEQTKITNALKRDLNRNVTKFHYNTLVLSDDLRLYKKTPLEMSSKKPHFSRFDRMWSGTKDPVIEENRDFLSTYNASFNEDMKTIPI